MEMRERIRMLLDKNGMTQADLARKTDVAETTVSRYLNGSRRPKAPFLRKVADLFGVSMFWLVYGDEEKNEGYGAVRGIVARNAGTMTNEQKCELVQIIMSASAKMEEYEKATRTGGAHEKSKTSDA